MINIVSVIVTPVEHKTVLDKYISMFPSSYIMCTRENREKAMVFKDTIFRDAEMVERDLNLQEQQVVEALYHIIRNCP